MGQAKPQVVFTGDGCSMHQMFLGIASGTGGSFGQSAFTVKGDHTLFVSYKLYKERVPLSHKDTRLIENT